MAVLLGACAPLPSTQAPPADIVVPNANLVVQGIPPVPASIASAVARYTDFRGHRFVAWHPTRREMLVSHRRAGADTTQIFRIARPARRARAADRRRRAGVARRATSRSTATTSSSRAAAAATRRRSSIASTSRASRRRASPSRASATTCRAGCIVRAGCSTSRCRSTAPHAAAVATRSAQTLWLIDPMQPQARRRIADLPGGGWSADVISWDDATVALTRYVSALESRGLAARSRDRRPSGRCCRRRAERPRATSPRCGSATARASSSSAIAAASSAS